MKIWKLLVPMLAMVIVGCAIQSGTGTDDADGADGGSATSSADGSDGMGSATPLDSDIEQTVMNNRTVYFAFDSSEIDEASMNLLKQHGAYLAANPDKKARLKGNTDERGSREYNLGLGERRAVAVQRVLMAQGASSSQLTTISYGEERPADAGTGEVAWARNRRVDIVYQ